MFIYVHKNLFAPQASDLLEKSPLQLSRKHTMLELKIKKILWKISSKNLTAGV